jgi:hypothetical protein
MIPRKEGFSSFGAGALVRGLVATEDVAMGETVASVPVKSCLTAGTAKQFPKEGFRDEELKAAWGAFETGYDRLGLLLFLEFAKADRGGMQEYIDILPQPGAFNTPIHWTAQQLDAFPYAFLAVSTRRQKEKWTAMFESLQPWIARYAPYRDPSSVLDVST